MQNSYAPDLAYHYRAALARARASRVAGATVDGGVFLRAAGVWRSLYLDARRTPPTEGEVFEARVDGWSAGLCGNLAVINPHAPGALADAWASQWWQGRRAYLAERDMHQVEAAPSATLTC